MTDVAAYEGKTRAILQFDEEAIGPVLLDSLEEPGEERPWHRASAFALSGLPVEAGRRIVRIGERLAERGELVRLQPSAQSELPIGGEEVATIAELLAANQCRGLLRTMGGRALRIRAVAMGNGPRAIVWDCEDCSVRAPFVLEIEGLHYLYRLDVDAAWPHDGCLVTPLEAIQVTRSHRRAFRRAAGHEGQTVSFRHPLWAEQRAERRLRDCSWDGLAIYADPGVDVLYPGLAIPGIRVADEGGTIVLDGIVRVIVPDRQGGMVCGLRVAPASKEDEARWLDFVMRNLHVTTSTGEALLEETWALFERAGYFHLSDKEPEDFVAEKESFARASQKISSSPRIGRQIVWPSERGLEASMSMIKPFATAWFLHHMAKRRDGAPSGIPGRQILRDVYFRAYEFVQTDPDLRWLAGYAEAHVRWSQYAHFEFASRYVARGEACNFPFRLFEVSSEPVGEPRPMGVELGTPKPQEIDLLLATLARSRPRAYLEALDFVPSRFDLMSVSQAWAAAGLLRERAVLVARGHGHALLALILETAEDGTNLFHVLDGVRLVPFAPGAIAALGPFMLDVARAWYRARGKRVFVHYREEEGLDVARCRLRDLGEGIVWVLSSAHLPAFLEHIYRITSPKSDVRDLVAPPHRPEGGGAPTQRRTSHGIDREARAAEEGGRPEGAFEVVGVDAD